MSKKKKKNKKIEPKCKNCLLYTPDASTPGWGTCRVAVLHEGKKYHIPVEYENDCFFEEEYVFKSKYPTLDGSCQKEIWKPIVKNVRWWEEEGKVKIEYPSDFFGPEETSSPIQ